MYAPDRRPSRRRRVMLPFVDKVAWERHAWHNLTEPMWFGRHTFSASDNHSVQVLQEVK